MIADDDQRLRPVTNHRRDDSRKEQQQQQVAPQLADEHRKSANTVREQHVRPITARRRARLDARQAPIRRAKLAQHVGDRQPGSHRQIKLLRLVHLRRQGATAHTKHTIARGSGRDRCEHPERCQRSAPPTIVRLGVSVVVFAFACGSQLYGSGRDDRRPSDEATVPGWDPLVAERNVAVPKSVHRVFGSVERHLDVVRGAIDERNSQHDHRAGKDRRTRFARTA